MLYYLLICKTLTYAQRTVQILQRAGISATVIRVPQNISTQGCGYCVRVAENRLEAARQALYRAGMNHGRVFQLFPDGNAIEVFL